MAPPPASYRCRCREFKLTARPDDQRGASIWRPQLIAAPKRAIGGPASGANNAASPSGPPNSPSKHRRLSRSSGPILKAGATASHSSSFRQPRVKNPRDPRDPRDRSGGFVFSPRQRKQHHGANVDVLKPGVNAHQSLVAQRSGLSDKSGQEEVQKRIFLKALN